MLALLLFGTSWRSSDDFLFMICAKKRVDRHCCEGRRNVRVVRSVNSLIEGFSAGRIERKGAPNVYQLQVSWRGGSETMLGSC